MKTFINNLVSSKSDVSSKRFIGIIGSLLSLIAIIFFSIIFIYRAEKGVSSIDHQSMSEISNLLLSTLAVFVTLIGGSVVAEGVKSFLERKGTPKEE